ncbi:MAG: phospholipase D-like domain-containing protein [Planctomycetota bacterium]
MPEASLEEVLKETLADYRLTRGEKRIITKMVDRISHDEHQLAFARNYAFKLLRDALSQPGALEAVDWLEDVLKALQPRLSNDQTGEESEAYFSPDDPCVRRIIRLFDSAKESVDVCVFTITDDRISDAILEAHRRDINVRIISDNDKSEDLGSDVDQLQRRGVPVRVDQTDYHMHHKYAIFDRQHLLTGSYNWTRSAATSNEENFIITRDASLLQRFRREFEQLWKQLG